MNEIQRQQYLEAMGIETYMPRWILPSAAAAQPCAPVLPQAELAQQVSASPAAISISAPADAETWQTENQVPAATATETVEAENVKAPAKSAPIDVLASIESSAEPDKKTSSASAKSILADLDVAKRPDPHFALSLWRVSDDVMVVDSRHSELALPTEPLLRNILAALGFAQRPLPKAEVLRWPMFENSYEPQGQEVARETLQAMLEGMLETLPGKYLLLMGGEACHYLLGSEQLGEGFDPQVSLDKHLGQSFALEALSMTAIVVPSLSELLQQPLLKRGAWRALQPLRQR